VILTRELSWVMGKLDVSIVNFVVYFQDNIESSAQMSIAFFPNFTQNLMLIHSSKNQSLIFVMRCRNMCISVLQLPHNCVNA
jgi:hypothetical protein